MTDCGLYRVKVYNRSADNLSTKWQDGGTGYLYALDHLTPTITVISETDETELLNSPVTNQVYFHKTEDTLILWEDTEGNEHAISFQEKINCDIFLKKIESIKFETKVEIHSGQDSPSPPKTPKALLTIEDAIDVVYTLVSGGIVDDLSGFITFLLYKLEGNREQVASLVKILIRADSKYYFPVLLSRDHIDAVILTLSGEDTIRFQYIGDAHQELADNLEIVFKTLFIRDISYNPQTVLEREIICKGIGSYLSDLVDETLKLFQSCPFLVNLFTNIVDDPGRTDLMLFVLQIVRLTQIISSFQYYSKVLLDAGLIKALYAVLKSDQPNRTAVTILLHLIDKTPTVIRDCLQDRTNPQNELIDVLVHIIVHDPDPELKTAYEILTVLRLMIDSESLKEDYSRQHFVDLHFRVCLPSLLEPLFRVTEPTRLISDTRKTANYLVLLLDHLTLQVPDHSNQLHCLNIEQGLLVRVVALTSSRHNLLVLSSVRYFKEVMLYRPSYVEFVITHRLLDCLVALLCSSRYNMVSSAILEFFENVYEANSVDLATYIISEYYESHLSQIDYVKTFTNIKSRTESISIKGLFDSEESLEFETASDAIVRLEENSCVQLVPSIVSSHLCGQSESMIQSLVDYDLDSDDDDISDLIIHSPSKRPCIH